MKRLGWWIVVIALLPTLVFSKSISWEVYLDKAHHLVDEGKFEQALNYLNTQSMRRDLPDLDRVAITTVAVGNIFSYGDKKQALLILKPFYDELVKKRGEKNLLTCWIRELLTHTYLRLDAFDKALRYATLQVRCASSKNSLAQAYVSLSDVYRGRKDFVIAIKTYSKAETLFKQINDKGKYNSKLSSLYNNRGLTYAKMFNYKKALINYQTSLDMKDKKGASYYRTLFNMTHVYRARGESEKAKGFLIEIADYYLKAEGVNSLDCIEIENEIGVLDSEYGHYDEALMRYKKVLDYGERLGRDETKALALKNMGSVYTSLGDKKLAQSYLEKSLVIYQKLPLSIPLADNYDDLASLSSDKNAFQEELSYYDKSLAIRETLHQQSTPEYANVLTNKAMAYQKHRNYQQASDLYKQAFDLLEKVDPKGAEMGSLFINRGTLWYDQKNYTLAESMLLEAIEILKQSVGENHPSVAYAYNNLAMVYSVTHQREKSVDYYRKAIAVSRATQGPNHPSTKLYNRNLLLEAIENGMSHRRL